MASAPPLRVWLYSAFMVAGVFALLALQQWSPWDEPDHAIADHTRQFLDAPAAEGKIRVLGLGSSLLWASNAPGDMAAIPGVQWMRMTKPDRGIGYLAPSLDVIDHAPPDVLVIEENVLLIGQGSAAMEAMRTDFFLMAKKLSYRLAGQQWGETGQQYVALLDQGEPFQCTEVAPGLQAREIVKRGAEIKRWLRNIPIDTQLTDRLLRLSQRGVHIIVLELRRSESFEQATAPEKKYWHERLQQVLPPSRHIHYLASPAFTQANLHCDGSHMNRQGARLFSAWWQTQLQQWRKEI